ncbi:MAG TPA: dihydropteroate synthase, partial [Bacteroidetes bacterium]|nr:dihydropteroate synthase [Bacteroidota bacterium]
MGVINVTPDSFSDGGEAFGLNAAVKRGLKFADEGADILDVGGESTRPGSEPVSLDEELARVMPVIEALAGKTDTPISIDTYKSEVAREALNAGARLVNDISGGNFDPEMPGVVAETGAAAVLMHIKGTPRDMQRDPSYDDLIGEIKSYLMDAVNRFKKAGVRAERILVDPGIGFGKRLEH